MCVDIGMIVGERGHPFANVTRDDADNLGADRRLEPAGLRLEVSVICPQLTIHWAEGAGRGWIISYYCAAGTTARCTKRASGSR